MTSGEAVNQLEAASQQAHKAALTIDNLLAAHDYQDVAGIAARAGQALLDAAAAFMKSDDEAAFRSIDAAEDFLDALYDIVDGELDDEE
jgi:hypothetical protein